jgi:hypothetical protein
VSTGLCVFNTVFRVREDREAPVLEIKEGRKYSLGAGGGRALAAPPAA